MRYLLLVVIFCGCNCIEDTHFKSHRYTDFDKAIIVGNTYKLCSPAIYIKADPDNPYDEDINDPGGNATVIVEEKKNGYVKYCWDYDYKKPNHASFNRSYPEFMELIDGCR